MNLTVWDILSLISYSMVKSFLETAIIIVLVLGLSFILPPKIWKEKFIVRGSIAALGVLLSMIAHIKLREAGVEAEILRSVSLWWLASLTLTAILVGLLPKIKLVEYVVSEIADRTVVFLYIFLPVTVIGFFALIVRFLISL